MALRYRGRDRRGISLVGFGGGLRGSTMRGIRCHRPEGSDSAGRRAAGDQRRLSSPSDALSALTARLERTYSSSAPGATSPGVPQQGAISAAAAGRQGGCLGEGCDRFGGLAWRWWGKATERGQRTPRDGHDRMLCVKRECMDPTGQMVVCVCSRDSYAD